MVEDAAVVRRGRASKAKPTEGEAAAASAAHVAKSTATCGSKRDESADVAPFPLTRFLAGACSRKLPVQKSDIWDLCKMSTE